MSDKQKTQRTIVGRVVSNKMDKSISVVIERYVKHPPAYDAALLERVEHDARVICQALGYDLNTVEFAVENGVPYAIDFMNPAPDMDVYSLTPHYFEWVVEHMADMAIGLATSPRPQLSELRWNELF